MQRPMYVHRDNYARGAYRRFILAQEHSADRESFACRWCGQKPARLYNYQWEPDDRHPGQSHALGPWFCNFSCFTDYHN